jgi:hypothetical protein
VFFINYKSEIYLKSSNFTNNWAFTNGVFKVQGDSSIAIDGCIFKNNKAEYKNSIGAVFQAA